MREINKSEIAEYINILGKFCGKRDIQELTTLELKKKYNIKQADIMVLFGGSILSGGDVLANGIKNNVARKYIIVGGRGHTTASLERKFYELYPETDRTSDLSKISEAEIFKNYLKYKYNIEPDFLEIYSTNCGNNITNLLELLKKENISFQSIIISQDATMQLRMDAGLRKYVSGNVEIINFATYEVEVCEKDGELIFNKNVDNMWDIERYIALLMGEIPRLTDDGNGYGPKGKGYIAHVDIPDNVEKAFLILKEVYGDKVRKANPLYASK